MQKIFYRNRILHYALLLTMSSLSHAVEINTTEIYNVTLRIAQERLSERLGVSITPTGRYDSNTISAIKLFQKNNSLPISGLLDNSTAQLLDLTHTNSEYSRWVSCYVNGRRVKHTNLPFGLNNNDKLKNDYLNFLRSSFSGNVECRITKN
ncbi:MAG: peptidoglycan-binding protein [Candidatus Thiodiazotropha sp. (ex Ctena orbiculata)]|nr:peptidoglycan-binding protein [Candidatus Thiodiazotropha taylori]